MKHCFVHFQLNKSRFKHIQRIKCVKGFSDDFPPFLLNLYLMLLMMLFLENNREFNCKNYDKVYAYKEVKVSYFLLPSKFVTT